MSNRTSAMTILAVSSAFVLAITLLVILQKSQRALELSQQRLHTAETNYIKIKQQFEALHEYKDRLEKSFLNFKTEKGSKFIPEKFAEMELYLAKEVQNTRQIQSLQNDLKECRQQHEKENIILSKSNTISLSNEQHKEIEFIIQPTHQVPITLSSSSSSTLNHHHILTDIKSSALAEELKQHLNGNNNMKDAIQSPIGHVPPVPALPSGDPNEDLAGNVII